MCLVVFTAMAYVLYGVDGGALHAQAMAHVPEGIAGARAQKPPGAATV